MQNNIVKNITIASVTAAALLSANLAFAGKVSPIDLAKKELRSVPTAEMPAQAAKLVSQAKSDVAETTAETIVTAALEVKSAAALAVVSAISRQNGELAPVVAAKAASLQPKSAAAIARAAAAAAPAQAAKIAYAVCKVAPAQYATIATAIAQVAPTATKEILASVTSAVPALVPFVERATSRGQDQPMGVIMAQTQSLVKTTAQTAKVTPDVILASTTSGRAPAYLPPPTVGAPFTQSSGSPTELNHNGTIELPPGGGRNYFGP